MKFCNKSISAMFVIAISASVFLSSATFAADISKSSFKRIGTRDGTLYWQTETEVAPGKKMYTNILYQNFFGGTYQIATEFTNWEQWSWNQFCEGSSYPYGGAPGKNTPVCNSASNKYWERMQNNDLKFCKLTGNASAISFIESAPVRNRDKHGYQVGVRLYDDYSAEKHQTTDARVLVSVVCERGTTNTIENQPTP